MKTLQLKKHCCIDCRFIQLYTAIVLTQALPSEVREGIFKKSSVDVCDRVTFSLQINSGKPRSRGLENGAT